MNRWPLVLLFGSSSLFFSSLAAAQTPVAYASPQESQSQQSQAHLPSPEDSDEPAGRFGGAGYVVLSVEQLFGFHSTKVEMEVEDSGVSTSITEDSSGFSFLGGSQSIPYGTPRVGVDFFLGNVATLGASAYMFTSSSETDDRDTTVDYSGFFFNPRFGVFFGGPRVGFWGRGGFAFYSMTSESEMDLGDGAITGETTSSGVAFSLDAMLAINLTSQIAVTLGPSFYLPVSGSFETKYTGGGISSSVEGDQTVRTIAANVGLSAAF